MTTTFKNFRINSTLENAMTKIWVGATSQPISREIYDALMTFKNQRDGWNDVGTMCGLGKQ